MYVTSDGEVDTVLTNPGMNRIEMAKSLIGSVPAVDDATMVRRKKIRISKL